MKKWTILIPMLFAVTFLILCCIVAINGGAYMEENLCLCLIGSGLSIFSCFVVFYKQE